MKKFISIFLVLSVLALSTPLTAKERKGADLIIQKTDETQVRGELIAVKENSLLLLDRDSGADVSFDIRDIRMFKIKKKSKALVGAGIGLIIGGALTYNYLSTREYEGFDFSPVFRNVVIGVIIGFIPIIIGTAVGMSIEKNKTIEIEGKSDSEIKEILEKLRKKSRIKNAQ